MTIHVADLADVVNALGRIELILRVISAMLGALTGIVLAGMWVRR